jgi:outer membrane lipoprotein SlyB
MKMKKLFTIILALAILSVAAMPSLAQGRDRRINNNSRTYYGNQTRTNRINNSSSYYDYRNRDRSFWDEHRDKVTVAGSTVGGAIIGGLIGGRKGAVIGALAGAGSSALYTYKIRDRHHRGFWR